MPRDRGLFITLEGVEGVGKSTNLEYLKTLLTDQGIDLVVTREPGGTPLAEDIRTLLLTVREEAVSPKAELLLMFAARAQHIAEVIEPALAAGRWVLCDRFTDATYAYQSGGRGIDPHSVRQLEQLAQGELRPDCTFLLDCPVDIGLERARGRGAPDRFESEQLAFFERVRSTYLRLAVESSGRFRIIDAQQPLDEVQRNLQLACQELLACRVS